MRALSKSGIVFVVFSFFYGIIFSQPPGWAWAKNPGSAASGNNAPFSLDIDPSGNVYVLGYFNNSAITFGSTTLTNKGTSGTSDIMLVKYDSIGNVIWAKSAGGADNQRGTGMAVDASGYVYVTGYFYSSVQFEANTLTSAGKADVFLAKYDGAGNLLWVKSASGTGDDLGTTVATDASGRIFLGGYFQNTLAFGSPSLTSKGAYDAFVAKYDSSGNALWAKSVGGNNQDVMYSVTADPSGNVVVVGYFNSGVVYFGSYQMGTSNYGDCFVAKYNPDGKFLWAKNTKGNWDDFIFYVTTDAESNIYYGGSGWSDAMVFPCCTLQNPNANNNQESSILWFGKCDSMGNTLWAKSAGGDKCPAKGSGNERYDRVNNIFADASGNIYVAGQFYSASITLDNIVLDNSSAGGNQTYDLFILKCDKNGNVIWAKSAGGGSHDDIARGFKQDASGNIYVSGYFGSPSLPLGALNLTNTSGTGMLNMFTAKLSDAATGIKIEGSDPVFRIYPNPSEGKFTVFSPMNRDVSIKIVNSMGEVIYQASLTTSGSDIDLSRAAPGVYFVHIKDEKKLFTRKIIIH